MNAVSTFAMLAVMSGITVAAILIFKYAVGRRLSPVFNYFIWLLLLIRLIFPVLPQSRLSLYNLFDSIPALSESFLNSSDLTLAAVTEHFGTGSVVSASGENDVTDTAAPSDTDALSVNRYNEIVGIDSLNSGISNTVSADTVVIITWVSVAAAALTVNIIIYLFQRRSVLMHTVLCCDRRITDEAEHILAALHIKKRVRIFWGRRSMLLGVFSPAVILDRTLKPDKNTSVSRCTMVLTHELTHLRAHDNVKNFIYTAFCCIYWFNPLLLLASAYIRSDAEMLCDYNVLRRFGMKAGDYAGLLYDSVKTGNSAAPAAAPTMSKAGRQLIRRLSSLSGSKRRVSIPLRLTALFTAAVIAVVCLTNPVTAVKSPNLSGNYMVKYISLLGDRELELPDTEAILTVRGFIEAVILAFDSAELPYSASVRLQTMKSAGTDYLLEGIIKDEYKSFAPDAYEGFVRDIEPDDPVTREQAAFLLNSLLLLLQRDRLILSGDSVPYVIPKGEFEQTLDKLSSDIARRKLNAFYTLKTNSAVADGSDELTEYMRSIGNLIAIIPFYSFDGSATHFERSMITRYMSESADYSAYQLLEPVSVLNIGDSAGFVAEIPPLLPAALPVDSYENELLGTADESLRAELAALYEQGEYNGSPIMLLKDIPDESVMQSLGSRILNNTSYTYARMLHDQALCGYDYITPVRSVLPMRDYYFTRDDGSEVSVSLINRKEFDYLLTVCNEDEAELLNAYFLLKDPNAFGLSGADREKLIDTFRISTAAYIFDPYATAPERADIDAIIAKYATEYTSLFALPTAEYTPFPDENLINQGALASIRCLQTYGVYNQTRPFRPDDNVSFGDAAAMIVKLYASLIIY